MPIGHEFLRPLEGSGNKFEGYSAGAVGNTALGRAICVDRASRRRNPTDTAGDEDVGLRCANPIYVYSALIFEAACSSRVWLAGSRLSVAANTRTQRSAASR